jgi:CHASE2 domain-containing sensor protein
VRTRRETRLAAAAVACLAAGALLLFVAGSTPLRVAGALVMLGFVVLGAVAILNPERLERDD